MFFYSKPHLVFAACWCETAQCGGNPFICGDGYSYDYVSGPTGTCTDTSDCYDVFSGASGQCGDVCAPWGYCDPNAGCTIHNTCADWCVPSGCDTTPPEAVNLQSPSNGWVFPANTANVVLDWEELNSNEWGNVCDGDQNNEYLLYFGTTNPPPFYSQGGPTKTVPVTQGQTYYWRVETTNGVDNGEGVSDTWSFSLSSNSNPTGQINTPANGTNFQPNSNITITATGTDPDPTGLYRVDILGRNYNDPNNPGAWFAWASNGSQQLCSGAGTCNSSKTRNTVPTGTYQIILRVVDNYDADYITSGICAWDYPAVPQWTDCGASDMIIIDVRDNTAPTASITAPSDNSTWILNQTINLAGTANDTGGLTSYGFMRKIGSGGTWVNLAPNNTSSCNIGSTSCTFTDSMQATSVGTWYIAVYATDNTLNTCAGNWLETVSPTDVNCGPLDIYTINVIDPQPPTGTLLLPTENYTFNTRTNVGYGLNVMRFSGSDVDTTDVPPLSVQTIRVADSDWSNGAALTYSVGALTCNSTTACSIATNWSNPVPGLWRAYVKGTDGAGMSCSGRPIEGYLACDRTAPTGDDSAVFYVNASPNGQFSNEPLDGSYTFTTGSTLTLSTEAADAASFGVKQVRIATKLSGGSTTYYSPYTLCNDQASCTPSFTWPVSGQPAVSDGQTWVAWLEVEDTSGARCTGDPATYATTTQTSIYAKCDITSDYTQDYTEISVQAPQNFPWFTSIKGNVFIQSGIESVSAPQVPALGWNPAYLTYGKEPTDFDAAILSDSSVGFSNGQSSPTASGLYAEYIADAGAMWPETIPSSYPVGALDLKSTAGANGTQCSQMFRRVDGSITSPQYTSTYQISDLACLQQAINAINSLTPYRFTGASGGEGILVIYVNGSGVLTIPNQFVPESGNNRRILFVLGSNVTLHYDDTFGNAAPTQSTAAIIQASVLSRNDVYFDTNGSDTDTTAIVEGPLVTSGTLYLNRDRGIANNSYPAEMFIYNYRYLYRLTLQSRASANENYTGLMVYDVQYD